MNIFLFIKIYRDAYESSKSIPHPWEDSTLYLYIFLFVLVSFCGVLIEGNRKRTGEIPVNTKPIFIFIGVVLSFFLGLRGETVGADTIAYRNTFDMALEKKAFAYETTEPGYQYIMKLLHLFLPSNSFAIFIFSTLTVYFILSTVWKYRNNINVFIAITFYVGIFYFQALSLMRIYLAAAFMLFNVHYLMENKIKKFAFMVMLSSLFHYSSLIFLLPTLFLYFYKRNPFLTVLSCVLIVALILPLASRFGDFIMIARYAEYADSNDETGKIGYMLFFEYLPCFYFLYYIYEYKIKGRWGELLICFTLVGLFVKLISYHITIAGRLGIHFMPLFLLIIPCFVNHVKLYHKRKYHMVLLFLMLYVVVRLHFYFLGYIASDAIMPYSTIFD